MLSRRAALLFSGLLMLTPTLASAQGAVYGQIEFMNSCAHCHGAGGKGDGVIAGYLNISIPDLTEIQRNNGGVFPFASLYGIIDGTDTSGAHGTSDMPAWGQRYTTDAPRLLGEFYSPSDQELFIRGRILALIEYISTIQEE